MTSIDRFNTLSGVVATLAAEVRAEAPAAFIEAWDALGINNNWVRLHVPDDGGAARTLEILASIEVQNGSVAYFVSDDSARRSYASDGTTTNAHPYAVLAAAAQHLPTDVLDAVHGFKEEDLKWGGFHYYLPVPTLRSFLGGNPTITVSRASDGTEHEHLWRLVEDGYQRVWHTKVDEGARTIVASDSSVSDDGDGSYLECERCRVRLASAELAKFDICFW